MLRRFAGSFGDLRRSASASGSQFSKESLDRLSTLAGLLLNAAHKLVNVPTLESQIVVGQLPPFLFHLAADLVPLSLHLLRVDHRGKSPCFRSTGRSAGFQNLCISNDDAKTRITIELKHANARKLLKELEDMDIIKFVESSREIEIPVKPSQLRGFLSKEKASALLSHIEESREEWQVRFPFK